MSRRRVPIEVDALPAGPDEVWRSTFLCFRPSLAEDAEIVGHWLSDVMYEAGALQADYNNRASLRAVARDLHHLERFVAAARLDLSAARPKISCLVKLIGVALAQGIRLPERTPAFRETFLLRLPKDVERPARALAVHLQDTVGEARARHQPSRARQGVIAELSFLAAYLREVAQDAAVGMDSGSEGRLGRFAGRMADRLEQLAQSIGERQPEAQGDALHRGGEKVMGHKLTPPASESGLKPAQGGRP